MPTKTLMTAAEFELTSVDDPYGYASAAELSLFRRPLPTTNLKFLSAVMWDGRETFSAQSAVPITGCERWARNKKPGSILPGTEQGFQLQLTQGEAPHALS